MKYASNDIMESFRKFRCQSQFPTPTTSGKDYESYSVSHSGVSSDKYQSFLERYWDLENNVDSFTTQDLMYFFREKSKEAGFKYVISNMKRDLGIFKRLRSNYTNREICLMVEFLFFSDQDYLEKDRLQPTVLTSTWCSTIYADSMLWLEDKYIPSSTKRKKLASREWISNAENNSHKIGDWT